MPFSDEMRVAQEIVLVKNDSFGISRRAGSINNHRFGEFIDFVINRGTSIRFSDFNIIKIYRFNAGSHAKPTNCFRVFLPCKQQTRVRVSQYVFNPFRALRYVQRNDSRSDVPDREIQEYRIGMVVRKNGNPVLLSYTLFEEITGKEPDFFNERFITVISIFPAGKISQK